MIVVPEAADVVALTGVVPAPTDLAPHITLLYPLPGLRRLHPTALDDVANVLSGTGPIPLRFEQTGRFPGVLYLDPTPSEPLVALINTLAARFPEYPPYGGAFDEIIPHLSVVNGAPEPPGLEAAVKRLLPLSCVADTVCLASLNRRGRWVAVRRFSLHRDPGRSGEARQG